MKNIPNYVNYDLIEFAISQREVLRENMLLYQRHMILCDGDVENKELTEIVISFQRRKMTDEEIKKSEKYDLSEEENEIINETIRRAKSD